MTATQTLEAPNVLALIGSFRRTTVDDVIAALLDESARALESRPAPASGSLFQFVVGMLARTNGESALRRFVIVDSSELRDLYSVTSIPRRFDFGEFAEG
jgi:hypothetical protein